MKRGRACVADETSTTARARHLISRSIEAICRPMRLPGAVGSRRDALSLASLAISALPASLLISPTARPALAAVEPGYNPGQSAGDMEGALGGLKPGTGRPLNALIKMRAETGVERVGDNSPLFKPGQIFDQLRTADGGSAEIVFAFPQEWTLAGGPNLDVRDVKQSDSAFVLAAALPPRTKFEALADDWFLDVMFDPAGKFGQYGELPAASNVPAPPTAAVVWRFLGLLLRYPQRLAPLPVC